MLLENNLTRNPTGNTTEGRLTQYVIRVNPKRKLANMYDKNAATSLLSCNSCGGELKVVSKEGSHLHVQCVSCGLDNSSGIANRRSRLEEENKPKEIEVQVIKKRSGTRLKAAWK